MISLATLFTILSPVSWVNALPSTAYSSHHDVSLQQLALQKVLQDASPIFGYYTKNSTSASTWMKKYPDETEIVHMNLPGTHDAQTWNYSLATQESLNGITAIGGEVMFPPEYFRCQAQSINDMLNAGIRVFDLRYAFDPLNSTLVFWHSQALQSETATVEDVLFGFYKWLDDHPSEAVLISLNYEGSTTVYARNNAAVQLAIFNTLTSPAANKYILQKKNEFGTLGEARGKITLLRRFDLNQLPPSYSENIPGIYFPASQWLDNDPDITLVYNSDKNLTAYIEDYYEISEPIGAGAAINIDSKYNATTAHLSKASTQFPDSLFWSFASSEHNVDVPSETPVVMALGSGDDTPLGGVNQRLEGFFKALKGSGKRVGIVMFDFFDTPGDLISAFLEI